MYDDPYPRRRKKSKVWLIVLLAVGIPLGLVSLFLGLGALFLATAKDLPVTAADREVLLEAGVLAEYVEGFDPSLGTESVGKKRFLDGSHEVEYEYEHPEDDPDHALYVLCTATIEKKGSDARITYAAAVHTMSLGLGFGGLTVEARDDLFSWGDDSKCALLRGEGGAPVGNLFSCRDGTRVFQCTFIGVYFDEVGGLAELLQPILTSLRSYRP